MWFRRAKRGLAEHLILDAHTSADDRFNLKLHKCVISQQHFNSFSS